MFVEVFKEEVSLRTKALQDVEMHRVCVYVCIHLYMWLCTCVWCACEQCPVLVDARVSPTATTTTTTHVQEELTATVDEATDSFESELMK